jgi:hypothetical protein
VCRCRRTLRIVVYRVGREHRRAQANRRFVMGRADLRAYYQARVAGMSDFRKKLRTVRPYAVGDSRSGDATDSNWQQRRRCFGGYDVGATEAG